eukprot:224343-Chlamydomonas_euryale.AAC.2
MTGRTPGRRRPAAPTPEDLSHTLVEARTRPKTVIFSAIARAAGAHAFKFHNLAGLAGLKASKQSTHPQASASRALPMSRRK